MVSELGSHLSSDLSYTQMSKARLTLVMLACMALSLCVLLRAAYIQLPGNTKLETMARRQFQSHSLVRPRRGSILDRNGEPLAVNLETSSLAANPSKIRNKRALAKLLARSVDVSYGKIFQKLSEKREFIWIKRHLSDRQLRKFRKWRIMDSDGDLVDGLWLVKESERVYPHGNLASHVIGDVNVDSEGLEGVELWMNELLRGKVVSVSAIKDALGRPTFIDAVAAKSVQDGEPVSLTIDASLQYEIEQELSSAVHKTGAKSGTVIVMNATNGEILAMANEPSFNPNEKGAGPDRRRNRALTDGYEPGSTLKALLMAGILANGGKSTDQVWGERGSFIIQGHKISEAEAHEKFEWVSLKKMIQVSSNVAAAKFALKLGPDRYLRTMHAFGLGNRTGIGFPGEIQGKIPARKEWSPLALANFGFGQGILVTPIQMVRAYASILNGGWLIKPSLLKKKEEETSERRIRIFSQRVSREVLSALSSVTEEGGTGVKAALLGFKVAGKTGTAQMVDPATGRYSREKYISSFIGFALDVDPKIVIFTELAEPHGTYYASETAVPLFREVLNSVANRCSLPVSIPPPLRVAASEKANVKDKLKLTQASYQILANFNAEPRLERPIQNFDGKFNESSGWVVPSLKGLSAREVVQVLKGHRLHLEVVGSGIVTSQSPEIGKTIAEGGTIRLLLSEP